MDDYGEAVLTRDLDGTVKVERADPVIVIALQLLTEDDVNMPIDESGCVLLGGYPSYRYRPVRFAVDPVGRARVLVCERVVT